MGELVLDIDHITEWLPPLPGTTTYRFRVAPAELRFHEASDLVVTLDYTAPRFALLPMTLHDIQRAPRSFPNGYRSFDWTMTLSCPHDGQIRFSAVGYHNGCSRRPLKPINRRCHRNTGRGDGGGNCFYFDSCPRRFH